MYKGANVFLRLTLEFAGFFILAYWGYHIGVGWTKLLYGLGVPLTLALTWSLFGAPRADYRLRGRALWALEAITFLMPVVALAHIGEYMFAVLYGVSAAGNRILMHIWHQF